MARTKGWGPGDIVDLTGRTALVTGANSGIGLETAVELASHGAHVVLACRNPVKAARAADHVLGYAAGSSVEILELDLASPDAVRAAAGRFTATHERLDILINNAGVMGVPPQVTPDGVDLQVATNHLGPFAFTGLLLDTLLRTAGSRVVTVSSMMHRAGRVPALVATGGAQRNRWLVYGDTKLANLAFTYELDRRLRAAGAPTLAVAAHPGWAHTNLVASGPGVAGSGLRARMAVAAAGLGQSAARGALPVLYAATEPGVQGGEYFGPSRLGQLVGPPTLVHGNRRSRRREDALALWDYSEEATGVRYGLGEPAGGGTVSADGPRGGGGTSR